MVDSFMLLASGVVGSTSVFGFVISNEVRTAIVGLLLILVAILVLWKLRQFIANSLLGIVALFLLQFVGIAIPVNLVTILIAGVLGLIGVGLMVLLTVLGFKF